MCSLITTPNGDSITRFSPAFHMRSTPLPESESAMRVQVVPCERLAQHQCLCSRVWLGAQVLPAQQPMRSRWQPMRSRLL